MDKKEKRKGKGVSQRAVGFMYEPPPGYLDNKKKEEEKIREEEEKKKREEAEIAGRHGKEKVDPFHYEELGKRFPFLKNAPTSDESAKHRTIRHNPLGLLVRNVRCARCGNWGHRSGDRDCPMLNAKTINDTERLIRDDPLTAFRDEVYLSEKLVLTRGQENEVHGGFSKSDPLQQMVPEEKSNQVKKKIKKQEDSSSSEDEEVAGLEQEFFESLSEKEMKTLLKRYKKEQTKAKKKEKKKKRDKEKTHKDQNKKKRKSRSSSSSPSPNTKRKKKKS